ncbi:mechanosensitive ion channel family protein [Alteromonas sediminis]|uniref:Small-conductance mechanosensitive channel n=1 Tax=Alteromonas sediminis TaxID=2259342 RepID=A0A3N5ZE29_9ALTE|nr:mechanosensitive ion channel family protein [Alteromonas sediminis]RPJ68528.1 mechanosensitive ion channel family protein [Alteromonas sediminis]
MEQELEQIQTLYNTLTEFAVTYSFQIVGAIIIIIIGAWVASKVGHFVEHTMRAREIDITLSRFTGGTAKTIVLVLVFIIALGQLGISVTPFIAAIGALGLGAGLAIQGMLSNYAAGFTIIITRPFVVNDTIKVQGVAGLVAEVHLGYTILLDEDNVRIQIPNRLIVGEILHNSAGNILVELSIGVAYSSNTDEVMSVISNALEKVEGIDENNVPLIGIDNFGDSSINFGVRFWAPTDKHYQIKYAANKAIHDAIIAASIEIPFPQREVRMLGD